VTRKHDRYAKVNIKMLITLLVIVIILGGGLAVGYKVRKRIIANRALVAGKAALEQEDWAEACKHLKQYLSKYPDDVDMLGQYAEANLSIRPLKPENLGAALAAYRRLLRKHKPGDGEICRELIKLYFQIGDFEEAAYICRQRLETDPNDVDATASLGKALVGLGKNEEAANVLEALVKQHSDQVDAYVLLSNIALQDRSAPDFTKAKTWLDQAVSNNPQSSKALAHRARFWEIKARQNSENATADRAAALADLEAADALHSKDPTVLFLLFDLFVGRNDLERAESQLRAVEQLDAETLAAYDAEPDTVKLLQYTAAARLALRKEIAQDSIALADRALKELTGTQRTTFLPTAIELYLAGEKLAKARQCLEQLEEQMESRRKNNPSYQDQLEILRAAVIVKDPSANPFDAINKLREIVLRTPENTRGWRLLGDAYKKSGQKLRSIKAMEEYIARAPGDADTALKLAQAYLDFDRVRALRYAEHAERVKPDDFEAKLLRIRIQIDIVGNQPAEATQRQQIADELRELSKSHPKSAGVRILQAAVTAANGNAEDAISQLEQAIEDCDDKLPIAMQLARQARSNNQTDIALRAAQKAIDLRPDLADPRYLLATVHEANGHNKKARQTFETAALELTGQEQLKIQALQVDFLLHNNLRKEGLSLLRQLAKEHPQNAQLKLALLKLSEIQADTDESQKLVQELRNIEGDEGLLWPVEQARLWLNSEQWQQHQQEMDEILTRVIEADPSSLDPVLLLGQLYEMQGDYPKAEETYRQSINTPPLYTKVIERLLGLLERQGRFPEAAEVLKKVPKNLVALSQHRINVGMGMGNYDLATEELKERIAANPQDANARVILARLTYIQKKDVKTAFDLLDQAVALSPDLLAIVSSRVAILLAEDRQDEALALLNKEVNRHNNFDSYLLRAKYYEATDQFDLAEKDYRHLTSFPDTSARAHSLLARFYGKLGKIDQAIAACEAGLKNDPKNFNLQRILTLALLTHKQEKARQRGQEMLENLLQSKPNDAALLRMHADILLAEAETDVAAQEEALATLERVVAIDPHNVQTHLRLINLARNSGDLTKASQLATRALGANPGNIDLLLIESAEKHRGP